MGNPHEDLPSTDLPCVYLSFYALSCYLCFRFLCIAQEQQQPGVAYMQAATAQNLSLLEILDLLTWGNFILKGFVVLWSVNCKDWHHRQFPEVNEVQEISTVAAFLHQLSSLFSALSQGHHHGGCMDPSETCWNVSFVEKISRAKAPVKDQTGQLIWNTDLAILNKFL